MNSFFLFDDVKRRINQQSISGLRGNSLGVVMGSFWFISSHDIRGLSYGISKTDMYPGLIGPPLSRFSFTMLLHRSNTHFAEDASFYLPLCLLRVVRSGWAGLRSVRQAGLLVTLLALQGQGGGVGRLSQARPQLSRPRGRLGPKGKLSNLSMFNARVAITIPLYG